MIAAWLGKGGIVTGRIDRLVLHLGLPKTGTTTLQAFFGSSLRGYFGPQSRHCPPGFFGPYREALRTRDPSWWKTISSHPLRRKLRRGLDYAALQSACGTVLFSWEGALAADLFMNSEPSPRSTEDATQHFIRHLRAIVASVFPPARSTVILLTVRRQPELLGSLYAQRSRRIKGAGQADFDFQLRNLIELDFLPQPLDFFSLSNSLQAALNAQSVLLLPLEQIKTHAYRQALGQLLEIDTPRVSDLVIPLNQRGVGRSTWQLRETDLQLRFSHSFREAGVQPNRNSTSTVQLSQEQISKILSSARAANTDAEALSPNGLAGYT